MFIPLIKLVLKFFSRSSEILVVSFPFISTYLMVSTSNIPKYLLVSFSGSVLILSLFGNSIPSVICLFPLLIFSMAHLSMPNSIPMS